MSTVRPLNPIAPAGSSSVVTPHRWAGCLPLWAARSLVGLGMALLPWLVTAREKAVTGGQGPAVTAAQAAIAPCTPPRCAITVSGRRFMKDGKPWVPKGVVVTGFLAPRGYIKGTYAMARGIWGVAFLRQLQAVGVDALRFNVSIGGLDPTNAMPDGRMTPDQKKVYLQEIVDAVSLAEAHGMASFVTLTNGEPTGAPDTEETPGPEAARAWAVLAPALANRPSVAFIAFNEPGFGGGATIDSKPEPWQRWRSGYQLMVDAIRRTGARNVIVLDGIATSRVWRKNTDANIPRDPVNQLAFDLHPFPTDAGQRHKGGSAKLDYYRPSDIEHWLDGWCDRHACIASAFFTGVSHNPDKANCYDARNTPGGRLDSPAIAEAFLRFFDQKGIGVMAFAGDWNHRLFDKPGRPDARLTSFSGFAGCSSGDKSQGPGELLKATWMAQLKAEGTPR